MSEGKKSDVGCYPTCSNQPTPGDLRELSESLRSYVQRALQYAAPLLGARVRLRYSLDSGGDYEVPEGTAGLVVELNAQNVLVQLASPNRSVSVDRTQFWGVFECVVEPREPERPEPGDPLDIASELERDASLLESRLPVAQTSPEESLAQLPDLGVKKP